MDNKIKLAIETFYGIPIPPDADMIQQTINLTDVVGILEIYAAQQPRALDLCQCGEDCIPMFGEDTCVRCDLVIGTSQ